MIREIKKVEFLTPARVTLDDGGHVYLDVDIIGRKAYTKDGSEAMTEAVFEHLDSLNSLPGDFFASHETPDTDIGDVDSMRDMVGEINGE